MCLYSTKSMKNKFRLIVCLLFVVSCNTEFEKNTRVLVKGNLIDQNNSPIVEAEVSVYTRRATGFFSYPGGIDFLLGRYHSNIDGSFSVTSLFDKSMVFSIEIDAGEYFSRYSYVTNTVEYSPEDLVFDLQTQMLKKLSKVNFNITRASARGTSIRFNFIFQDTNCIEFFDQGNLDPLQSSCFIDSQIGGVLNDTTPEISSLFITALGSTVSFSYSINEEPEITQSITIDQENYDFNFSY